MPTPVTETPAATPSLAREHFEARLQFETDCWDVHEGLKAASPDFILVDVRSPSAYVNGHIDSAINIPHGKITAQRMADFPPATTFVVYCSGPHCNGADKAAVKLARLGLLVKMMIGGVTGWLDEGFTLTAEAGQPSDTTFFDAAISGTR